MKVCAASVLAIVAEVVGKVMVVESVPSKVRVFATLKVFPLVMVRVPVEEVIVSPFIEVAVATPKVGVVRTGEVNVLLVRVSVVALPTRVSVALGNVIVPVVLKVVVPDPEIEVTSVLPLKTLLVRVWVSVVPTTCVMFVPPIQLARVIVLLAGVVEGLMTIGIRTSEDADVACVIADILVFAIYVHAVALVPPFVHPVAVFE